MTECELNTHEGRGNDARQRSSGKERNKRGERETRGKDHMVLWVDTTDIAVDTPSIDTHTKCIDVDLTAYNP